jgi:two-component system sensor histidine kinase ComP
VLFGVLFLLLLQKHVEKTDDFLTQDELVENVKKVAERIPNARSFTELRLQVLQEMMHVLPVNGLAIAIFSDRECRAITCGDLETYTADDFRVTEQPKSGLMSFAIFDNNNYRAQLWISTKQNHVPLRSEESRAIMLFTNYLALSLENFALVDKISLSVEELLNPVKQAKNIESVAWLQKSIFQLMERERFRLASDLHDFVLQDLYFLMQKINVGEVLKEDLIEHLELLTLTIRNTCFELFPNVIENEGVISAIQQLVDGNRVHYGFIINLELERGKVEELDMEVKKHIFRIVQELLANAKKHSEASLVQLSIFVRDQNVVLVFGDNGVGFDEQAVLSGNHLKKGSGLFHTLSRVIDLNGTWQLETAPNQGAKWVIHIPN